MKISDTAQMIKSGLRPIFYRMMQPRVNSLCKSSKEFLLSYKDKYSDQRCFIIGNGPSLRTEDLEKLNGEISFAANRIYVMFDRVKWRPTFYLCQDPTCLRSSIDEINAIDKSIIKFIRPTGQRRYDVSGAVYFDLDYRFSWGNLNPEFNGDLDGKIIDGRTVTYSVLQLAVYMGFREIYLLGLDCNYSPNNTIVDEKSYADKRMYNPNGTGMIPDMEYQMRSYTSAKKYADENDIKIYNATRGGKLEVFQRINFDMLFNDVTK